MSFLAPNDVYHGLSERKMKQIKPGSVALSFWSPPYFVGKEYEKGTSYDSWQSMLQKVIANHKTILKPGGFLVINIADILCFADESMPKIQGQNPSMQKCAVTKEMVLSAREQYPNYSRYQLAELLDCSEQTIDRRLNGNNIRGGKYQTQSKVKLVGGNLEKYAESVGLYLYDRRIWAKDPAWANSRWTSNTLKAVHEFEDLYIFWNPGEYVIDRKKISQAEWSEWGYRGLWFIRSVPRNNDHEAKFPLELAERVVKLFSNEGDVVLDPFMGSGTTALAALRNGRQFIGIDKEKKYVELSKKNIRNHKKQPHVFSVNTSLLAAQG